GAWHYHPGFVYNVVRQGAITVEDGCGIAQTYGAGQAFETSEGRVHRAYNLGSEDAIESNMFVGPPGRPITVFIPNNGRRCGPPSSVEECKATVGQASTIRRHSQIKESALHTSFTGPGSRYLFPRIHCVRRPAGAASPKRKPVSLAGRCS